MTDGARFPPERELAKLIGVSRAELRKALLVLEVEGSVIRHVGRGTFLKKSPKPRRETGRQSNIAALAEQTSPIEAMDARLALEPELARLAAMHATPQNLRSLSDLIASMRKAASWTDYERLDAEFHDVIAAASGNSLLHELHKIVNGVRIVVVWRRLDTSLVAPPDDYHSFQEHDEILDALERRAPGDAQSAMRGHLKSTLQTMTSED